MAAEPMNRIEQSALVLAEVNKLIERDAGKFAHITECVASWACEVTDKLGFPVVVIPVWQPPNMWTVVSYAVPHPAPYPYADSAGPAPRAASGDASKRTP